MQDVGGFVGVEVGGVERRITRLHGTSGKYQVTIVRQHRDALYGVGQRIGVEQGQLRFAVIPSRGGFVDPQDIEHMLHIQTRKISTLQAAVHHHAIEIMNDAIDTLRRHWLRRGQQREVLATDLYDCHLPCPILHRQQVGEVAGGGVAYAAIQHTVVRAYGQQLPPFVQKRNAERLTTEAVGPDGIVLDAFGIGPSEDDGIIRRSTHDKRIHALLRHGLHGIDRPPSMETSDGIAGIPVAGDDHTSAVHNTSRRPGSLLVETAEAGEGMRGGIVGLHGPLLSDSQVFLHASSQQHLAGWEHLAEGEIGGVNHVHEVPLAVGEVFSSLREHEAAGVSACRNHLSASEEE